MIEGIPPVLQAAVFTLLVAILRILADGERRFWRILIESFYCVGLAITAFFLIVVLDMRLEWTVILAGLIGSLGSAWTRVITHTLVMRRLQMQDIQRQGFTHHTTGKEDDEIHTKGS